MNIVFTGGGTAGHVTPNIALIKALQTQSTRLHYIGSAAGPEADMISQFDIPFSSIACGKLRRYFSWHNFIDPFKTVAGICQAWWKLGRIKPDIVFSKGGFVAFPVVVAAWLRRIPVLVHESDFTPGLANKLSFPFAAKICCTFAATKSRISQTKKVVVTGTPIRESLFQGDRQTGLSLCGLHGDKPVILIMGGSQGSHRINQVVRESLSKLLTNFSVVHLCGKGNTDPSLNQSDYCQFEYVDDALPHLFAATDMVISRAGANALYEILALQKPNLLIPLSANASRGDQIENARYFSQQGVSRVLFEADLNTATFLHAIEALANDREHIVNQLQQLDMQSGTPTLLALIKEYSHDRQKSINPVY